MTDLNDAKGVLANFEPELLALHLSGRVAGTFATTAALQALPVNRRKHGHLAVTLATRQLWVFDQDSSATASNTVLAPDAGSGRWLAVETKSTATILLPADNSWFEATGAALAAFADGASATPGLALDDSEAAGIRWNNHATPDAICKSIPIPKDLDRTAALAVRVIASKTGETVGDATTFDVGAFFNVVGALRDADADAGGTTSAMTGDAATKTVQEVSVAIAHGDVPDTGEGTLTITLQPTDGTLGTDDVTVHAVAIDYTSKMA